MLNVRRISPEIGYYLAGFADGEGSFNVSFKRERNYGTGWKVALSFNVSQRDRSVLELLQSAFACGTIRYRKDGVGYYEVRRIADLENVIVPFFERHPLKSKKAKALAAYR